MFKTDMYLMFDEVCNGEYNEYAVESGLIGIRNPIVNSIYLLRGISMPFL